MKSLNRTLPLLAAVVAIGLQTQTSTAGEALRSPRDASNQPRVATVSAANDPDLLRPYTGRYVFSPRFISNLPSITLSTSHEGVDVTRVPRPALSPKDSRFEMAWRMSAAKEVQVAPLK